MKIKKKTKEVTAFEKRNTSIVVFSLVALVPLLFSFLIGFSVSKTSNSNNENLLNELDASNQKADSLDKRYAQLESKMGELVALYSKADTMIDDFEQKKLKHLKSLLDEIEDGTDQTAFDRWKDDKEDVVYEFGRDIERLDKGTDFDDFPIMVELLDKTKSWLGKYAKTKGYELNERMLRKKLELGAGISADQDQEIENLKGEIRAKDFEIQLLKVSAANASGTAGQKEGDKAELMKQLIDIQSTSKTVKEEVTTVIDDIRKSAVNDLTKDRLLKNSTDNIKAFKDNLEVEIKKIERSISTLK